MKFTWHTYQYYPYEKVLAARELSALTGNASIVGDEYSVELAEVSREDALRRLTYFSGFINGNGLVETTQALLERAAHNGKNRQSTRYSVHGLHEYKGKFNPQVARAILNIFGLHKGDRVLDPFCGSGTTLVECAHLGAIGYGLDLNPLAVFIANAKLQLLSTPVSELESVLRRLEMRTSRRRTWTHAVENGPRGAYLKAWFSEPILQTIELLHEIIDETCEALSPVFLTIASNLLRDYSLQDPNDLRIRRRTSPLPDVALPDAFLSACEAVVGRVKATQTIIGTQSNASRAELQDVKKFSREKPKRLFDAAITSPPYAMALPYIDTQRLSLVWLNLLHPQDLMELEAELVGSREMRGTARRHLLEEMVENRAGLPAIEADFCRQLKAALKEKDGFRRQAVPMLLYRYFAGMRDSFKAIYPSLRPGAKFALIVGHNRTTLGGQRFDINTPNHLASLARSENWTVEELMELQTYRRYGYHVSNAVEAETLLVLRKP